MMLNMLGSCATHVRTLKSATLQASHLCMSRQPEWQLQRTRRKVTYGGDSFRATGPQEKITANNATSSRYDVKTPFGVLPIFTLKTIDTHLILK